MWHKEMKKSDKKSGNRTIRNEYLPLVRQIKCWFALRHDPMPWYSIRPAPKSKQVSNSLLKGKFGVFVEKIRAMRSNGTKSAKDILTSEILSIFSHKISTTFIKFSSYLLYRLLTSISGIFNRRSRTGKSNLFKLAFVFELQFWKSQLSTAPTVKRWDKMASL